MAMTSPVSGPAAGTLSARWDQMPITKTRSSGTAPTLSTMNAPLNWLSSHSRSSIPLPVVEAQ